MRGVNAPIEVDKHLLEIALGKDGELFSEPNQSGAHLPPSRNYSVPRRCRNPCLGLCWMTLPCLALAPGCFFLLKRYWCPSRHWLC
jgi:hypothetical protein